MKTAADVPDDAAVVHREARGLNRPADHHAEAFYHLWRPRQLELRDVVGRQRTVANFRKVLARMHEREIVPGGGVRFDHVLLRDHAVLDEPRMHELILACGEDVEPDIDVITRRVEDVHLMRFVICD
jgi:hypothetical protein